MKNKTKLYLTYVKFEGYAITNQSYDGYDLYRDQDAHKVLRIDRYSEDETFRVDEGFCMTELLPYEIKEKILKQDLSIEQALDEMKKLNMGGDF